MLIWEKNIEEQTFKLLGVFPPKPCTWVSGCPLSAAIAEHQQLKGHVKTGSSTFGQENCSGKAVLLVEMHRSI